MERKLAAAVLLALAAAAVLTGCSKSVLDYQNVQVENGKIYRAITDSTEGDTNKPFSGTVTNYPINEVLAGNQKSMERFLYVVGEGSALSNSTDAAAIQNLGGGALARGLLATTTAMCDVSVSDGYLDGHTDCKVPNSDVPSTQMGFDAGTLDGSMTYFDANGRKWAEAKFDEGAIKGEEKVYSPETGQLVFVVPWGSHGWDGDVKGYDAKTGELIYEVTYQDGKRQGVATSYSPDGKRIQAETFVDNVANGPIDTFDPKTGMHTSHGTMVNGLLDGDAQTWDAQGQLLANYVYKRGENVTPRPQVAAVDCEADGAKRTLVENMVCSNKSLLDQDTQMMKVYKVAAASLVDSTRLEDDQRGWLAATRNQCTAIECLDKAYKDRITQLSAVGQPDLFAINCSLTDRFSADDVRLICSDPNLVTDDQQMIASYKAAYVAVPPAEKAVIDEGIRNWVSSVRYRCRDAACMDGVFKDLTGKLNAIGRNPGAPVSAETLSSPPSETTSTEGAMR